MRIFRRLNPPLACSLALAAAALALLAFVRAGPRALPPALAADALSAFFAFATFFGLALVAAVEPRRLGWRAAAGAGAAAVAYLTPLVPLLVAAFVLLAVCTSSPRGRATRPADVMPLVAAALLAVGYGALVARGVLRYDDRAAGAALDGFVFWFVLLAAATALVPLAGETRAEGGAAVLRLAWLYPLARLYSLGPWNQGWSLAAALFGGALALWAAGAALGSEDRGRCAPLLVLAQLALALAGFGFGTGAGLAAGCFGLLVYGVLLAASRAPDADEGHGSPSPLAWLLTPAAPFAAPFVATWMLLGAGVAGGVPLLGAAAWLVALCGAVAVVLWRPWPSAGRGLGATAGVSLALGVLAPVVVLALIQPAIEQLQGGLSVYGDVNIWPWVGLAAVDSSRRGVTALPSIAAAALMLVLTALVYLGLRLLREPEGPPAGAGERAAPRSRALLAALRHEVPWLAATRGEERRGDDR